LNAEKNAEARGKMIMTINYASIVFQLSKATQSVKIKAKACTNKYAHYINSILNNA